ncbi:MAG: TadE family type IV pilus minor pilin, partial [Herbiconiux sp.]|nr:TadE family type IV pilus minor pilin [Herbiconiux sp.]
GLGRRVDDGSVTVEFALVLPAAILLLVALLGVLQFATVQVALTDAAADAARLLGRGEVGAAAQRVAAAHAGATMAVEHTGSLVCVTVTARASASGPGAALEVTGRGCALDDTAPAAFSPLVAPAPGALVAPGTARHERVPPDGGGP